MRDAEGMPEHDIGVFDWGAAVGYPFWDTTGWFTRGLGDVPACGKNLFVVVWGEVSEVKERWKRRKYIL